MGNAGNSSYVVVISSYVCTIIPESFIISHQLAQAETYVSFHSNSKLCIWPCLTSEHSSASDVIVRVHVHQKISLV